MLNRAQVVFVCLVPVLGLFSCSKDKDEWSLKEPVIVSSGQQEPFGVSKGSQRGFTSDAHLVFEDGAWSSLEVTTVCDLAGQFYEEKLNTTFRREIPLKSLWPASLLKNSPNASLVQSQCDIRFTAKTESGSSHDFELKRIKLLNFTTTDKAQTFSAQKPLTTDEQSLAFASDFLKELSKDSPDGAATTLSCGNDSVSISALEASRDPNIVRTLIRRLNLRGQRSCRFLVETAKTGLNDFSVTDEVAIQFPKVPVSMTWNLATVDTPNTLENLEVLNGTVRNEGASPTTIYLPQTASLGFRMIVAGTFSDLGRFFEGSLRNTAGVVTVASGTSVAAVGEHFKIELGTGSQFSFTIRFSNAQLSTCRSMDGLAGGAAVGLRLALSNAFTVLQKDLQDSDFMTTAAETPANVSSTPWLLTYRDHVSMTGRALDPSSFAPVAQMTRPGPGCALSQ